MFNLFGKPGLGKDQVMERLKGVMDPELGISIVDLGMVKGIRVEGGRLALKIALTVEGCPLKEKIERDVRGALEGLEGAGQVELELTTMAPEELEALKRRLGEKASAINSARPSGEARDFGGINRLERKAPNILAVTSGKGGVGKSSVTAMLAAGLQRMGKKVGVLDADITGPSIARVFGARQRPEVEEGRFLVPVPTDSGVRVLSMNLLISDERAPVVWRGPLVNGAIRQLYGDARWEGVDFLLVDLPPGTSDANLTVFQSIPLDGVVIVSSPQDLVRMIVAKSITMAQQLRVPVLGLVENMATLACPHCGEALRPYGPSRGEEAAREAGIPFLGSLPIDPALALACDQGRVHLYENPAFEALTRAVLEARQAAV